MKNIPSEPLCTELIELTPDQFERVAPWFSAIHGADIHLEAIRREGCGHVYADDAQNPSAAFLAADDSFSYLAGDASLPGFAECAVNRLIHELLPGRPPEDRQVILFSTDDAWKEKLDALLAPYGGFRIRRHAFAFDEAAFETACAALPPLADGYELRTLTENGPDTGIYKSCEQVTRCGSFTGDGKAEIDIHTAEAHRRRGLAMHACAAFLRNCRAANLLPQWSCWDYNDASVALAKKLGFRPLPDLTVNFCELQE